MKMNKKFIAVMSCMTLTATVIFAGCGKKSVEDTDYRSVKFETVTGTVTYMRNEKQDAYAGMLLIPEDEVTVGADSEAVMIADTDKHIMANKDSSFVINATGDEKNGKVHIKLLYGDMQFVIDNKLTDDSEFSVETPNAVMSVRGTTFQVAYDKEKDLTYLEVVEGVVYTDYDGDIADESVSAGQVRIISKDAVMDGVEGSDWNKSLPLYDNGTKGDSGKSNDNKSADKSIKAEGPWTDITNDTLSTVDGGEPNDNCLEFRECFVDFSNATTVFADATIEKRSASNLVLYLNKGTENEYSIQYSTLTGNFDDDIFTSVMFKNGHETYSDAGDLKVIYTLEKEDKGTRLIILQEVAEGKNISIRVFNKTSMDNMELLNMILVKSYYPVHYTK